LCPEHQFLPNILAKILLQSNHRSLVLLSCNFLFKKLIQQLQRKLSFDNSITMYKELKTSCPAGFEPKIFWSAGGRDGHYATPLGRT
jgi:hypothetical protein